MQIHELVQGSPEWHQFRLEHFGASEAAAMLGLSKKVKRTELLHVKYTSLPKQYSDWMEANIFEPGHEVEALARPINEDMIGHDLYPVTCSEGKMSASCDGLTMSEEIGFEHKQYNEALFAAVSSNELPDEFMVQPQQCLMVTKAEKWLFCVSDGTKDKMATMWVYPDPVWFERITAGWAQFQHDLDTYVPVDIEEKPLAKAVIELPALYLQAEGKVVNSNMEAFGAALKLHLEETRKQVYITDQDFADAESRAKLYRETCEKLNLTKDAMLSQTVSIGEAFRLIDTWHEDLRVTALQIEKDCEKNKTDKKVAYINEGKIGFTGYIAELELGIEPVRLHYVMPNFAEAIKGKRLFSAMHDAIQTTLANAKIEHKKLAAGIAENLAELDKLEEYRSLFNDLQTIAYKQADDFKLLVASRIAEQKKREAEKLEIERQNILTEERARVDAAAILETQRIKSIGTQVPVTATTTEPAASNQRASFGYGGGSFSAHMHKPLESAIPTLRLGQISERLGFAVTAYLIETLGIKYAKQEKSAILFHEHQFAEICDALTEHIGNVKAKNVAQLQPHK